MKTISKLIFCISFLLLLNQTHFSQEAFQYAPQLIDSANLIVKYELQFKQDTMDLDYVRVEKTILIIGSSISQFLSENLFHYLNKLKEIENQESFSAWLSDPNKKLATPKIMYKIFKNYPQGMTSYVERIPSTTFKYEEIQCDFEWHLFPEVDTIYGFQTQLAKTRYAGREWIAWFSPEIPYTDGPYKFCGLPGLILKVHDTKMHYIFEIESIEKLSESVPIEIPDDSFVQTTRDGFLKAKENFRNDIISRAKDAGLSSEAQQTAARNLQKRNNPIELH